MRFFEVVLSGAAIIAAAWALELNDVPSSIEPGKTYTITYSPKDNTATTFKLRKGDPDNLDAGTTLTTTATGGSFQWTVDNALENDDDYAIEISQGDVVNYSGQITLTGGSDSSPSSAASSGTPTPTASGSASSVTPSATASGSASVTGVTSIISSASASIIPSASSNGTISSATLSRTSSPSATGGSATGTSSGGPPESTGAASTLMSSPLALIFGAVAAMAYLN